MTSSRGRQSSPDCTQMVVLGLLARHGPQHGYQLRKLIEAQNIDHFSNVQLGSIYATLKRLARDGMVEARATEMSGPGPARAIHAITDEGRSKLDKLIGGSFTDVEQPERPVDLALHFSSLLSRAMVVELLEQRIRALAAYREATQRLVASTEHPDAGVQELIRDIGEHFVVITRAEHEWTTRVLECARQGGYRLRSSASTA